MATAKSTVEEQLAAGKELSLARDPKAVMAVAAAKVQPGMTNAAAYNEQLGGIIAEIREEFTRAADAHMTEAKSTLSALIYDVTKNVRPGSENAVQIVKQAIDNAFAGYEQVTNATRQAVANVEAQVAKAAATVQPGKK
jgi:phasin family protein